MIRVEFKTGLDQTMCTEDNQGMEKTIGGDQDMTLIIEVTKYIIQEVIEGMGDWIIITMEGETLGIKIMIAIAVGHMKDRAEIEGTVEALVIVDQGQFQGQLQIEIGSDVLSVGEYDHFARDCPTRQGSREAEQIQQMFNMDEDQTILQTPLMDTDQDEKIISPVETRDNLNL